MTILSDLTRTAALLRAGWPITNLARAKRAQEQSDMTRDNPIADPRIVSPRPRRQCIPVLHVEAAPDPIDDDAREFVAQEVDVPTIVRRSATTTEAIRQYAATVPRDSVALDPSHGIAQVEAMRDARLRRAHEVAWQTVKDIDGPLLPATIARLVVEALERDGVL